MKKGIGKSFVFLFVALILSGFLISIVSAATDPTVIASNAVGNSINSLSPFWSSLSSTFFGQQEWLTKILLSILLYMILYSIISVIFSTNNWVTWGITLIITILSVWFLPASILTTIRDQYGVMGAAILSVIPFVIMLIFTVKIKSVLAGRVLWIFWTFYYFAIFIYRTGTSGAEHWYSAINMPYLFAIVAGLVIIFTLAGIRAFVFKGEIAGIKEEGEKIVSRGKLLHKLQKEELDAYGDGGK